jgi:V/A-type H+-transporting ATPase subunit K
MCLIYSENSPLKSKLILLFLLLPLVLVPAVGMAAAYTVSTVQAQTTTGIYDKLGLALGAGLAVGLAALGAGLSIAAVGSATVSALAEKPETFFRAFLIVALAEALAIYGLIMGILLWLKL